MIYLDNAATTFPKPYSVREEVFRCLSSYCGNPGRGAHALSIAAAEKVFECRTRAASLFGLDDPTGVIFTSNTTHSLNIAIKGLLHQGSHVIISDMEHNAVYRVICKYADMGLIEYDIFDSMCSDSRRSPELICNNIKSLIKKNTDLLICIHASNICSAVMPIADIGKLCKREKITFIVDAAASAGHMTIDMNNMSIDALCVPGHKGLYGPQGSGLLLLQNGINPGTLIEGGNGINSLERDMSDILPEKYEAGTLATPAIAGLCDGINYINRVGIDRIEENEKMLYRTLYRLLVSNNNIELYGAMHVGANLLFNIKKMSPDDVGRRLNKAGICVRSGYHCSPLAHTALKTPESGAVRVSFGIFNTKKEIYTLYDEIKRIISER